MCEFAECSNHALRKARKLHKCCECGLTIETKERYWYTSGIFEHEPFSRKTCWDCQEIIDYLMKTPGFDCLEQNVFNELWDCGHIYRNNEKDEVAEPWLQRKGDYWKLAKYARALQTAQNYSDFQDLPL